MLGENAKLGNIKHEVLFQVAKAAFAGKLEEVRDRIPFDMIEGPQANFRCCIYREREIIRQRVRLAEGKPTNESMDDQNIIQVINSACEGCPITRFTVTDNCQKCISKKCQQACKFGAISMTKDRAYIDPSKCKECGKCSEACPYNAIADLQRPCKKACPVDAISWDKYKIIHIDEEKCITCGQCIISCPFGAIGDRSFIVDVINLINSGRPVYACVAPAIEGQFGKDVTIGVLHEAIKELGFKDMYEVALGADLVAESEAKEWMEGYEQGKKMTTSCCPAFVNMIKKHYPQLIENVSTTVSPMAATARFIKNIDPEAVVVFIGPCIAKKGEVLDSVADTNSDYALTFEELNAMFRAKEIDLKKFHGEMQQGSIYGKRFSQSGGVTAAVIEALKEMNESTNVKVKQCNGAAECKKGLLLLKIGRLPEDFIEGMACEGGCMKGPGNLSSDLMTAKNRETLLAEADSRSIQENIEQQNAGGVELHRHK
ncbi:MAG: 4Fe-4S dicluster domain-containing protein [bacterium]|nr:4Fe-4S dicluster domain-containing protein [bacterium]